MYLDDLGAVLKCLKLLENFVKISLSDVAEKEAKPH